MEASVPEPRVELLWWKGCPSTPEALDDLRAAMAEVGLDPRAVDVREISDDEDVSRERFVGSPTIRVDGRDVVEPAADEPLGLTCRIYRTTDGGVSAVPDPDDVRAALARALPQIGSES